MTNKNILEINDSGLVKFAKIIRVLESCRTSAQLMLTNEWAKCVLKNHYHYKNIDKYSFTEQIEIEKMLKTKLDLFDVLYKRKKLF